MLLKILIKPFRGDFMKYLITANTDIGIKKNVNQDCLSVKRIHSQHEDIVFAILCDGMGGLSKGELASSTVIRAYTDWISKCFIEIYDRINVDIIKQQWLSILYDQNKQLIQYGKLNNCKLGTTATIMLLMNNRYHIMNVGDTRVYVLDEDIRLITRDHSLINLELERGILTEEQARVDTRKNILYQCVGVSENVFPDFYVGNIEKDSVFLICSDGFRNKITNDEIYEYLNPNILSDTIIMKQNIDYLIKLNKDRNETDNIYVIAVRTYGD